MGTWHDYCIACGLHFCYPLTLFREEMRERHKGNPDMGDMYSPCKTSPMWLEKIIGIDQYEQILDLTYEDCDTFNVDCYGDEAREFYTSTKLTYDDKKSIGIICHKSCYNILQKYLDYKLKYRDLWPILSVGMSELNKNGNQLDILDYGEVKQYQGQWFEEDDIEEDLNLWMLIDPESTDGGRNRDRIIEICRPLRNKFVVTAAVNKIQRVWRKHYHRKVHFIIFIQIRWRWIIIRPRYKLCRDRLLNEFLQLTVKN